MEDKEIINEIKQDFKTHEEKYKQIEEMYQEFLDYKDATLCKVFSYKGMCENFVDLGYQKVEKDDIVISRKEYEALKLIESYHIKSCGKNSIVLTREEQDKLYQKGFDDGKEFAEKFYKPLVKAETVEKLIAKIKQFLSNVETVLEDDKYSLYPEIGYKCSEVDDFIDELANNSMLVED